MRLYTVIVSGRRKNELSIRWVTMNSREIHIVIHKVGREGARVPCKHNTHIYVHVLVCNPRASGCT